MAQYPSFISLPTNASSGFRLIGGQTVALAGDVNGDTLPDYIIGSTPPDAFAPPDPSYVNKAYVVFGGTANLAAFDASDGSADGTINLAGVNGSNGFLVTGLLANDQSGFGYSIAGIGDVNGDGFADIETRSAGAHQATVIFGKASPFAASINPNSLNG